MSLENLQDENGKYITDPRYKEILRLAKLLSESGIPHVLKKFLDGYQVIYPSEDKMERVADAIEHFGSYGNHNDLLEIMGLLTPEEEEQDCVAGSLTAEDVFERMRSHYLSTVGRGDRDE